MLAAIAVTCYFAISSMDYVDEEGDTHTGIAAARYLRDTKAEWEGLITEDVLREVIRQNRLINETYPDSPTDIKTSNIGYSKKQGFSDIRDLINSGFPSSENIITIGQTAYQRMRLESFMITAS